MDCKGFDEQVVRLDPQIADLAGRFVLARVVNMRGVELRRFTFDYDATWFGFFLTPDGNVLGRFGGRDAESPDTYLTLAGLKHAMTAALTAHRAGAAGEAPLERPADGVRRVDEYPAAKRLKDGACIHCHQVYDFRRDFQRRLGTWSRDDIWVYPPPDNLGFAVDPERQDRVRAVKPGSPAAGLRVGDRLVRIDGVPVASFADVQHALHRAPPTGRITVVGERAGAEFQLTVPLPPRWRETDISWRESMWQLPPPAGVFGKDLTAEEKASLGLGPKRLAFRQAEYVPPATRRAGVRAGDVIIGVDGKELAMTSRQFNAHVRLTYAVGATVTYNVLRDGKRVDIPVTLPGRD